MLLISSSVQDFDDKIKNKQNLIVFEDFVNLTKKEMQKLFGYAISSRKFGFTCIYVSQSYTAIPKIISRNCNYIMIFKIMIKFLLNALLIIMIWSILTNLNKLSECIIILHRCH